MFGEGSESRAAPRTGVVLVSLAVLLATLVPVAALNDPGSDSRGLARALTADALRNVILFAPLGAALAVSLRWAVPGVLIGAALSAAIEVAQIFIPGRYPSAIDVIANTAGTALGIAAVRTAPRWLCPLPSCGRWLSLCAGGAAAAVLLATGSLLAQAPTQLAFYGHRSPDLGHLYPYDGHVLSASLEGVELPHGRFPKSEPIRRALVGDYELRMSAITGEPPAGQAALLLITDAEQTEILLLGPDRDDFVYRYRTRASGLGLEPARLRLGEEMSGLRPGERLDLRLERAGNDFCVQVNEAARCGLGFTVGDGWSVLAPDIRALALARTALGSIWVAGLLFPLGFWGRRNAPTALACAAVASALLLGPAPSGLLPTPLAQLVGAGCGALAGATVSRLVARRP